MRHWGSRPESPPLRPFSAASAVFAVLIMASVGRAEHQGPVCEPGFLLSSSTSTVTQEVFDVGTGLSVRPVCTKLKEPLVEAEVEQSLRPILQWSNISERSYYWRYVCEGENISVERNFSANLPLGILGYWTTGPIGTHSSKSASLPLGTNCRFFGCYTYTIRENIPGTFNFNETQYIFILNDTSCVVDKDECSDGTADCEQECTDVRSGSIGSYQCSCMSGYVLREDEHGCTDVDECETGEHNCDQICTVNDDGWFNCSCEDGYTLHEDGHTCDDINECEMNGTVLCETETTGRQCINIPGTFDCKCPQGYELNPNETLCIDIDECNSTNNSSPCTNETNVCINTIGSYNCTCGKWYEELGPDNCTARDVCAELDIDCHAHSACVNYPDSLEGFKCECDSGYRQSGDSCQLKALPHIIWISASFLALTLTVIIAVSLTLWRKHLKNKHDIMKKYSVLFRYQMKREEIDPTYNPVSFTVARKVSYTFSLVSTLESYEYPLTPTQMEPEDTKSFESGFESNSCSSCGQLAVITDEDASKRELSPIIEGNEDRSSVGKAPREAHPIEVEVQKQSSLCTKQGKAKVKGCLSVEATNPIFAHHMTEDEANSSSGYVEDSNIFTHQSCTGDETQPLPCSIATVESYGAQFETEEMLNTGTDEVHESDRAIDPGPYIEGSGKEPVGDIADAPAMNSDNDSSLPHALMWRLPTANSGYIPSNFTTSATSSGYGSEEGYTSGYSYTSRLLSTSSCATDTSSGSGCCYIPSTTPSSGYVSETGFSRNKRGSLTSQVSCDTPCGIQPPQLGSEGCWAHSDYLEGTTGLVAESGRNSGNCSGTDSSTAGPLQRETHQLHLAHCSVTTPGTVVDSTMFHGENRTDFSVDDTPRYLNKPSTVTNSEREVTTSNTGYVPYPTTDDCSVSHLVASSLPPSPLQCQQDSPLSKQTSSLTQLSSESSTLPLGCLDLAQESNNSDGLFNSTSKGYIIDPDGYTCR